MKIRSFCQLTSLIVLWQIVLIVPLASLAQEGTLEQHEITSSALEGNLLGDSATRNFLVYLPPSYETSERDYPVFYVLHGFDGNEESLTGKVKSEMDRMIQNGEIEEMIAVFVDGSNRFGGSQYLSSPTIGDYETYIVVDIVNFVDENFRTIADRNSRGITGFSMGGYGSMHLALKYPDVFSVVVSQASTYDFSVFTAMAAVILEFAERIDIEELHLEDVTLEVQYEGMTYFVDEVSFWIERDEWRVEYKGETYTVESIKEAFRENPWAVFGELPLPIRNGLAYLAGVASNPEKSPFFLDLPVALVFVIPSPVNEVWTHIIENDTIHELDRYLNQPDRDRLNGIKLVHGTEDKVASVDQARTLHQEMIDRGIDHEYMEHSGGHTFIAEESLSFLSEHLVFITSVQPRGKLATMWGKFKHRR